MKSSQIQHKQATCRMVRVRPLAAWRAAVGLAILGCASAALSDTLLWYRFDGDGATIVNKANPGTMDGTLKSINTWGSLGGLGDTAAKFPTRGEAFPMGTRLIDPASGEVHGSAITGLSFSGDPSSSGTVRLLKADTTTAFKELTSFTAEAFFRLPTDSAAIETRRAKDILFPLLDWGSPDGNGLGWFFGLRKDNSSTGFYPFFRSKHNTGSATSQVDTQKTTYITDGNWHHLAVSVAADTSANTATVKLFLDYSEVTTGTLSNFRGFHYNNNGNFPFLVGADLWRSSKSCCFMGDIAEVRVSDVALSGDELLRPLPAGPMDADTLVYLPMGDSGWFGSKSSASYENKFHGILAATTNTAWTPYWVLGSSSAAYPAISGAAASDSVRGGYLSADSFADANSVLFSRALVGGAYQGHAVRIPYEGQGLTEGSFTMEWFFKTDGQVPSGNGINSYTFLNSSFTKIMINQANGLLLTRLIPESGSYSDYNTTSRVDDAAWHHYALVYDIRQSAFSAYLDYRLVASGTISLTTYTSAPFYFGGQTPAVQAFSGNLDDLRITRRALRPHEFLTSRECVSADTALFAHFDGDLSTGQDATLAPVGTGAAVSGGSVPSFVAQERSYDADGDGRADFTSSHALSLAGGSVAFPRNSMLECRDFTAEWFAKYESVANGTMLLRFEMGATAGAGTIAWALYYPSSSSTGSNDMRLGAHVSATGAWTSLSREDQNLATGVDIADGKWHHWALVADTDESASPANTTFTLYRDYEVFGSPRVFDGANDAGGILALPTTGTTLSFGTAGSIAGQIDELRFRPGVFPSSSFMRRVDNPFVLIVR